MKILQCSDYWKMHLSFIKMHFIKLLPRLGMIWSLVLPFRTTSPYFFFPKKFVPPWKDFFGKSPTHTLGEEHHVYWLLGYCRENPNRGGWGLSMGIEEIACRNCKGHLKKKMNFQGWSRENYVEFPGVNTFSLGIWNVCYTILRNSQG